MRSVPTVLWPPPVRIWPTAEVVAEALKVTNPLALKVWAVLVAVAARLRVNVVPFGMVAIVAPFAFSVCPTAVAVAAVLSTKVVPFTLMEATVAPTGIPGPTICCPTTRPVVLVTVTVVDALVVAAFASVNAAGIPAPVMV